ncbi:MULTISPECIES: zinc finger domain-containing protein [Micrococcaceae]|uniref:zinc finger domain-containing protein n=1 Tax=Micrococcaceae TaxID=1268 RepID=UPI00254D4D5C|nr:MULTISPECIES: zinc finger domain-containing protein [Micrococcaceae]
MDPRGHVLKYSRDVFTVTTGISSTRTWCSSLQRCPLNVGSWVWFSGSLSVYWLAGHACKRCETPIVREKFMNRSSHFCPVCQQNR